MGNRRLNQGSRSIGTGMGQVVAAIVMFGWSTTDATAQEVFTSYEVDLALTSYSVDGQAQYGNIYQRGAVVAGLLDIRLLELSAGRRGLRELILELADDFGPDRPFDEDGLFDLIQEKAFDEVGDFFDRYVKGSESLPIAEYYLKIGVRYDPASTPRFEIMDDATPEQLRLRNAWLRLRPIA